MTSNVSDIKEDANMDKVQTNVHGENHISEDGQATVVPNLTVSDDIKTQRNTDKTMSTDEALLLIQQEAQERRQRCQADIQETLKRHKCILDPFCIVRSGRTEVIVDVKPL